MLLCKIKLLLGGLVGKFDSTFSVSLSKSTNNSFRNIFSLDIIFLLDAMPACVKLIKGERVSRDESEVKTNSKNILTMAAERGKKICFN